MTTMMSKDRLLDEGAREHACPMSNSVLQPSADRDSQQARQEDDRLLDVLYRIGEVMAVDGNLEHVLQAVTDAATELTGAAFGAFFYYRHNGDSGTMRLSTVSGLPSRLFERLGNPTSTMFAPTLRHAKCARSDDITQDPRYGQNQPHFGMPPGHPPVKSYLAVPVLTRDSAVIGTMLFGHPKPGVFTPRSERVATAIAGQAAIAINNSTLYAESLAMESALRRLNETLEERIVERTRALGESEDRYRRMVEDAPAPVHSLDRGGRVIMVSRRWLSFFGYNEVDVLGRRLSEFMTEKGGEAFFKAWPGAVDSPGISDIEAEMIKADGSIAHVLISCRGFRTPAGEFIRSMGMVTDITQRQRTEIALRQSQKLQAVGQLAAGVGHDFNNCAMAAKGGLTIFLKRHGAGLDEKARLLLNQIIDRIAMGGNTAHRLLAFARRDALNAVLIKPAELLLDLTGGDNPPGGLLAGSLGKSGVSVVSRPLDPDIPSFEADRAQLLTVLINLAINARDAMSNNGGGILAFGIEAEVVKDGHVHGLHSGSYIRIDVADTGEGMSDEVLARCTEPFFTTKAQGDGTGLGLPMAHGFAEQSGGALRITSTPGIGTTISLFLPVAAKRN